MANPIAILCMQGSQIGNQVCYTPFYESGDDPIPYQIGKEFQLYPHHFMRFTNNSSGQVQQSIMITWMEKEFSYMTFTKDFVPEGDADKFIGFMSAIRLPYKFDPVSGRPDFDDSNRLETSVLIILPKAHRNFSLTAWSQVDNLTRKLEDESNYAYLKLVGKRDRISDAFEWKETILTGDLSRITTDSMLKDYIINTDHCWVYMNGMNPAQNFSVPQTNDIDFYVTVSGRTKHVKITWELDTDTQRYKYSLTISSGIANSYAASPIVYGDTQEVAYNRRVIEDQLSKIASEIDIKSRFFITR